MAMQATAVGIGLFLAHIGAHLLLIKPQIAPAVQLPTPLTHSHLTNHYSASYAEQVFSSQTASGSSRLTLPRWSP
jgi:hypothetical protein